MRRWALGSVITTAVIVVGACSSAATPSPSASAAPSAASAAPSAAASASSAPSASASAAPSAAAIAVPANITSAGKLVFCSDISYPPEESYAADGTTPQGSDIDIANEIAKRLGVKAEIDNTGFGGIIPALNAKKCDLIISGMNDTPTRAQQVSFVDYLKVGQGLLVPAGNPKNLQTLADLSGHSVAVELGTTNKDALDAENKVLVAAGKPKIDIQTFQADTDAFNQLKLGRVDAYSGDSPVCAYYAAQSNGKFIVGGSPIAPALIGIAIRKTDTQLTAAVQAAIDAMYADGTMKSIVDKWGMTNAVVLLK
ncbi:MAG: ABC transporter substrate-binding protein [Chloroflexi bacterium]|nr:ABC transporter substrate-binding protein [Chloroflexota bacterium]